MDDASLIPARIRDLARQCETRGVPQFFGFLSLSEKSEAFYAAEKTGVRHAFFGGAPELEREFIGFFPDWCEQDEDLFPIKPIGFSYRECDTLSHSDFLGALMSLGIERRAVGDILVGKGKTLVFVSAKISDHILSQITEVGRTGVKAAYCEPDFVALKPSTEEKVGTAASSRLDCVVSELFNLSRSSAKELIECGGVVLNGMTAQKPTHTVSAGDRLSSRGRGKFKIEDISGKTKKGRTVVKYKKYI